MAVRLSSLTVKSALVVATLNNPPCFFFCGGQIVKNK